MLHVEVLTSKIVLLKARSQQELGRTFLRFQEHYESPEWKGKVFTIGQIRAWYAETYGADTYERDQHTGWELERRACWTLGKECWCGNCEEERERCNVCHGFEHEPGCRAAPEGGVV
jgi:hypothetical protein